MHQYAKTLAIAALAGFGMVGSSLSDDGSEQIGVNVSLFDELLLCSEAPEFAKFGLARTGPCGDWIDRVEAERDADIVVLRAGYECTAADIRIAGNSRIGLSTPANAEHFNFVKMLVDECRGAIGD